MTANLVLEEAVGVDWSRGELVRNDKVFLSPLNILGIETSRGLENSLALRAAGTTDDACNILGFEERTEAEAAHAIGFSPANSTERGGGG